MMPTIIDQEERHQDLRPALDPPLHTTDHHQQGEDQEGSPKIPHRAGGPVRA